MSKKTYSVPVFWEMYGYMEIEAESKDEAIHIANRPETPLPEGEYVMDSMLVDDYDLIEEVEDPWEGEV